MRWRIALIIFRKELRETLRDRRTLVVMVGLPVVLYPALLLLAFGLAGHRQETLRERPTRVVLLGEEEASLRALVAGAERVKVVERVEAEERASAAGASAELPAAPPRTVAERLVSARAVDLALELPAGTGERLRRGEVAPVVLYHDATRDESRSAASRLEKLLEGHRRLLVERALAARGLPAGVAEPLRIETRNVASPTRMGGFFLSQVLPVLLVSLLVMGAFYPAIDLTAGEKERATLETLMTSPVRPLEVVTGKYLAVLTIALLAAVANLCSMGATLGQTLSLMPGSQGLALEVAPARLALLFVVLVPLGMLAAALSLAVAVLAKSFKEAQNLLTPTLLLLVVPATVGSAPGMELEGALAFVPGMNTALLTRALLLGDASAQQLFTVMIANLVLAALALVFAARNFSSEAVLFGGATGRRFAALRLGVEGRARRPEPGEALAFYGGVFVLLWYGGQAAQRWHAFGGLLITQWVLLFGAVVAFSLWRRFDLRETLRLRWPTPRALTATCLVAAGLPLCVLAYSWLQELFLPTPGALRQALRELFSAGRQEHGDLVVFFTAAVSPGICEELAFRGVLLDGFSRRFSRLGTVLLVALLFGAFHLSLYRFLPTALAGAALTFLALESGSIVSSMLAHALYNGTLLVLTLYLGDSFEPPGWAVAASVVALALGLWLVRGARRAS